jgi:hypothetical protein
MLIRFLIIQGFVSSVVLAQFSPEILPSPAPTPSWTGSGFGNSILAATNTLIIGAPEEEVDGQRQGAVYIRSGPPNKRISQRIARNDPRPGGAFGVYLEFQEPILIIQDSVDTRFFRHQGQDWLDDGEIEATPGSSGPLRLNSKYLLSGKVVYSWPARQYIQTLDQPDTETTKGSITSSAMTSDRVAIGSIFSSGPVTFIYEVWVYEDAGQAWTNGSRVLPPGEVENTGFGSSLVFAGNQLLASAPFDDERGADSGAVHVFTLNSEGSWAHSQKLTPVYAMPYDYFGSQIVVDKDLAYISAPFRNEEYQEAGAIFVFQHQSGLWKEKEKIVWRGSPQYFTLGSSLAVLNGVLYAKAGNEVRVPEVVIAFHPSVFLRAEQAGESLRIIPSASDPAGLLESATTLNNWNPQSIPAGNSSTFEVPLGPGAQFFRVRFESAF